MKRRLVAAIACRNQGSRLYGKPIQNLDVATGIRIIDNIVDCLRTLDCIDEIVLGISEGVENEIFKLIAEAKDLRYVVGDPIDVLSRLVKCGQLAGATDIFRVTSESPFLYFEAVEDLWRRHQEEQADATFMDDVIDGCGFEIISLRVLEESHAKGDKKHRSELCTLYIREHHQAFRIIKQEPPMELVRNDLRLTVDNPEDLAVCRIVFGAFKGQAPSWYLLSPKPGMPRCIAGAEEHSQNFGRLHGIDDEQNKQLREIQTIFRAHTRRDTRGCAYVFQGRRSVSAQCARRDRSRQRGARMGS
jgi:spore coat polysaccharide biosynthesis protein SpsF